ncbi:hypothetical protein [Sutterella wadsworthensis]|uniref:hypothetical protein n=1 Tax=Sutterella wadsworthensis TaxID=40545 RepID=UPI003520A7E2
MKPLIGSPIGVNSAGAEVFAAWLHFAGFADSADFPDDGAFALLDAVLPLADFPDGAALEGLASLAPLTAPGAGVSEGFGGTRSEGWAAD